MNLSVLVKIKSYSSPLNHIRVNVSETCNVKFIRGSGSPSLFIRKLSCQTNSKISFLPSNCINFNRHSYSMSNQLKNFQLNNYDCIGFDLDNTICEYKINPMAEMEYNAMSKFLVNKLGYDSHLLFSPLTSEDVDFMQRGLLLDFEYGNILKLGEDGSIIKASHGLHELSEPEIQIIYGDAKRFKYSKELLHDVTCAWKENLKSKFRILLDSFDLPDLPASLLFARAVDTIDDHSRKKNYFSVGKDIISTLIYMYHRDHFRTEESEYFKELKANPDMYINKCSSDFQEWLKMIGKSKKIFLVTGSNCDYASFTASYCLGKDWRDLFDLVVCFARKPGFFHLERPFLEISKFKEMGEVEHRFLECNNIYSQGNWIGLHDCLCRSYSSKQPKFLYFGDNVVEDIFSPYKICDTVAISEEMSAEKLWITGKEDSSAEYLVSKRWGSFFYDNVTKRNTLWGSVIKNCAKICLPSVHVLSNVPF